MDKHSYPQHSGNGHHQQQGQAPGMYQASDGKWYPVTQMPQGSGYGQQPYGHQQPMHPHSQPVYVQQQKPNGGSGGMGCVAGLLAGACCGLCLC
ncbi:uncharacterized protein IL334_006115 [Kwoniella shivajii]|uniref:Cysteine-rich transmembrane CYSTM domain-containing protein n=1 Tax=Kwoniella shivajii TaxID=564305 RepID=A0ABZ1D507_9TREE|nr:hypothetical protein IL334_006115 [Kwoniella shivajii]